jgi:F-type H+-transporting ATPase subunit b
MPQFDPTFFSAQLFWLLVTFGVLYLLMRVVAMPKLGGVLEERQRKIDDNLDKASQLKAEADAAVAVYEKALAESRGQAQQILRANADAMAKRNEQLQKEQGERLAAHVKADEAQILAAKEDALAHIRELAVDVAKAATGRLTGMIVADRAAEAAVASVLKEGR